MNNRQKHLNKMTTVDLYYDNWFNEEQGLHISSFYKTRKRLKSWSKKYTNWQDFKRFSDFIRD
jgi:hypothetical protein